MKLFALLAILFFSFRVFSEGYDYFYVDEYIRSQEDSEYLKNLEKKQQEEASFRLGVEEYKDQKFFDEQNQEASRLDYVSKKKLPENGAALKAEKEYESQKQKEQFLQEEIEKRYAYEKMTQKKETLIQPYRVSRAVASFDERKRIPKKERKYRFKRSVR